MLVDDGAGTSAELLRVFRLRLASCWEFEVRASTTTRSPVRRAIAAAKSYVPRSQRRLDNGKLVSALITFLIHCNRRLSVV